MNNKEGGQKAKATNLAKNPNFYRDIGRKGREAKVAKGFAVTKNAAELGKKGGQNSKRGKAKKKHTTVK